MIRTSIRSAGGSRTAGLGFQLNGGVGDLELLRQQLVDGGQHGARVCRLRVVHDVSAQAGLGAADRPDMQFMQGHHPWQVQERTLELRQIDAFGDAFEQDVERLFQEDPTSRWPRQ